MNPCSVVFLNTTMKRDGIISKFIKASAFKRFGLFEVIDQFNLIFPGGFFLVLLAVLICKEAFICESILPPVFTIKPYAAL